ncbi:uncharacterized protein NP_2100A [Natronomonas pharaonis DSM 2160]|uniref:Flagella cluster protein n=1 Tax=Natronomonas pharaonis (strain ATCC 35678 / DSM 2160 / CIP 103997 / JCM 8858 / NBRC 14720 / NCIMB 2260 / Gabara) TaxID=348780 RepID=A0A1U7EVT4_NATPD|nr:hypothetical protein [Natronomonas pharaonis]CAI49141.1 uncharacterized protein NP_2100A [Natronomonas pharaonis DSM 2160]
MPDDIPPEFPDDDGDDSDDDYVDPDVPNEKGGGDGGKVLSPDELDLSDSEYVEELDDQGRYVVSPGSGPPNVPDRGSEDDRQGRRERRDRGGPQHREERPQQDRGGRQREPAPNSTPVSPEAARSLLADELERTDSRYGLDIVARFDGTTVRHRTASDDVIATFENLVQWYAQHVTDDTPADEVIDILLRESALASTETPNLAKLLRKHDLDTSDSIAELVDAIRDEAQQ